MTGTYPDIPGVRFDLSKDGSLIFGVSDSQSAGTYYTQTQIASIMDLDASQGLGMYHSNSSGQSVFTILFPEPRRITGLYWQTDRDGNTSTITGAAYSLDTADGFGGTWSNFSGSGARVVATTTPIPFYRSNIQALSVDGVRAIRLTSRDQSNNGGTQWLRCLHIYGTRPTVNIDRLAFWHPTLDQELPGSYFDFGDTPRGVITGPKQFRIKNLSATKAATALQIVATGLSGSPIPNPGALLSTDQATWVTTTTAVNLAAGALTPVYYLQLNTADTTQSPQARSARLSTIAGSYA